MMTEKSQKEKRFMMDEVVKCNRPGVEGYKTCKEELTKRNGRKNINWRLRTLDRLTERCRGADEVQERNRTSTFVSIKQFDEK